MANEIQVKGFYIVSKGDESVGIWERQWELSNEFWFENEEELNAFRESLKQTFADHIRDDVYVETFEEREEREKDFQYYSEFDNIDEEE